MVVYVLRLIGQLVVSIMGRGETGTSHLKEPMRVSHCPRLVVCSLASPSLHLQPPSVAATTTTATTTTTLAQRSMGGLALTAAVNDGVGVRFFAPSSFHPIDTATTRSTRPIRPKPPATLALWSATCAFHFSFILLFTGLPHASRTYIITLIIIIIIIIHIWLLSSSPPPPVSPLPSHQEYIISVDFGSINRPNHPSPWPNSSVECFTQIPLPMTHLSFSAGREKLIMGQLALATRLPRRTGKTRGVTNSLFSSFFPTDHLASSPTANQFSSLDSICGGEEQ